MEREGAVGQTIGDVGERDVVERELGRDALFPLPLRLLRLV